MASAGRPSLCRGATDADEQPGHRPTAKSRLIRRERAIEVAIARQVARPQVVGSTQPIEQAGIVALFFGGGRLWSGLPFGNALAYRKQAYRQSSTSRADRRELR